MLGEFSESRVRALPKGFVLVSSGRRRGVAGLQRRLRARLGDLSGDRVLSEREARAARALATEAYFEELERALK